MGWIQLLDMMGSDERVIQAMRGTHDAFDDTNYVRRRIRRLMKERHTGPFEHVTLTLLVYAPEIVWRQWMRHRTQSYSANSGRYVARKPETYLPTSWRGEKVAATPNLGQSVADHHRRGGELYDELILAGVTPEQARLALPGLALYSAVMCTMNLHNLFRWLDLRLDEAAQWEIRQYAHVVLHDILLPNPRLCHSAQAFIDFRDKKLPL